MVCEVLYHAPFILDGFHITEECFPVRFEHEKSPIPPKSRFLVLLDGLFGWPLYLGDLGASPAPMGGGGGRMGVFRGRILWIWVDF